MQIRIRKAEETDLETIVSFCCAIAEETEQMTLDPAVVRAGVFAVLSDVSKGFYLIAEEEGSDIPAGQCMITFEWSDWRCGAFWWLQSVYVREVHRKNGVFSALLFTVRETAREAGACGLRLYVDSANTKAQKAYTALGMEESHYIMYEEDWKNPKGGVILYEEEWKTPEDGAE